MKTALIGFSGFVGSTLLSQHKFSNLYNSKNIDEISNKKYDLVVCAAAPGEKWKANKFPQQDLLAINSLIDNLNLLKTKMFVLVSTIDVYPQPQDVNEESSIDQEKLMPYGKNRFLLECFVKDNFSNNLIVRLPALFGKGMKKNFIFDLIHNNVSFFPHPQNTFQFYPMKNIWRDIEIARKYSLKLINLISEPISAAETASFTLSIEVPQKPAILPYHYDVNSRYADLYQNNGKYIYTKQKIMPQLKSFIHQERKTNENSRF